jgi:hypothetical protein
MKTFFIVFLLLVSPSIESREFKHFNDWSKQEKIEFMIYTGLSFIDYQQTEWAMEQKDANGKFLYKESNPLSTFFTGKRPNNEEIIMAQLVGLSSYYLLIAMGCDKKIRHSLMGMKVGVVAHNESIGISVTKVF